MSGYSKVKSNLKHFLKRYKKWIYIFFPVIVVSVAFLFYYQPPFDLLGDSLGKPAARKPYFSLYDDSNNGGHSEYTEIESNQGVAFKYTLKKGFTYPYSGISFSLNDRFFDFSDYDFVRIRIRALEGTRLTFLISTYIDQYTRPEDFNTLRNNQCILNVTNQFREIQIALSKLKTPDWWYTMNHLQENHFGKPDFSKVKNVNISNCIVLPVDKEDLIEITELSFHVDLFPFFLTSGIFMLFWYAAGFIFLRKTDKPKPEINFIYEKREIENRMKKEEESIFGYLTSHYYSSELTIGDVQISTGIYEQKIATIIKKQTGKTFKQFLNLLRISEAKRLLTETDLQVSEIAFKVGYGNVSHFNRVFKEHENCAPNDFRKQKQQITSS